MKTSEILLYPLSQAPALTQQHFKAAQHSQWYGRLVHYVIGGLECVPGINYLVALVELVCRAIFKRLWDDLSNFSRSNSIPLLPIKKSAEFFKGHQIELMSPLIGTIEAIQEEQQDWKSSDSDLAWTTRIRRIKESINDIQGLIQREDDHGKSWRKAGEDLRKVKEKMNERNYDTCAIHSEFLNVIGELKAIHINLKEDCLRSLDEKLQRIAIPNPTSLKDYLKIKLDLQISKDYSEQLGCRSNTLEERGIKSLEDLKILKIDRFDQDLAELLSFRETLSIRTSLLPLESLLRTLQQFCITLTEKIQNERKSGHLSPVGSFIGLSDRLIELLKTPYRQDACIEQLEAVIQMFNEWDLLRQRSELKAYIHQDRCAQVWGIIKASNSAWTLKDFCEFHGISDLTSVYQLSDKIESTMLQVE